MACRCRGVEFGAARHWCAHTVPGCAPTLDTDAAPVGEPCRLARSGVVVCFCRVPARVAAWEGAPLVWSAKRTLAAVMPVPTAPVELTSTSSPTAPRGARSLRCAGAASAPGRLGMGRRRRRPPSAATRLPPPPANEASNGLAAGSADFVGALRCLRLGVTDGRSGDFADDAGFAACVGPAPRSSSARCRKSRSGDRAAPDFPREKRWELDRGSRRTVEDVGRSAMLACVIVL